MTGDKILVIEGEEQIRELLVVHLTREGFQVITVPDGQKVRELCRKHEPKLIVLDLMLPGMDGYELCRMVRNVTDAPIILVSAKDDEADKVIGFGIGADDYVTKPFGPGELVARIKAHLRRYHKQEQSAQKAAPALIFKGLEIELISRKVRVSGQLVSISSTEFELLTALAMQPDRVYRPDQLFRHIWGVEAVGDIRTLQVHMSNLRKKVECDPDNPKYIITLRGRGYKFNGYACL